MKRIIEANFHPAGSVRIEDSFWSPRLDTFFRVTLPDSLDKLEKDGVLDNYENLIAGRFNTHKGCPWHDGLLLETIRGASDYIKRGETSPALIDRLSGGRPCGPRHPLLHRRHPAGHAGGRRRAAHRLKAPVE